MKLVAFTIGLMLLLFTDNYVVRGLRREIASLGFRILRTVTGKQ